jgi:hypothetical protein
VSVTVIEAACASVTSLTVITWPETPTVPVVALTLTGFGAPQLTGTVISTLPSLIPPASAAAV